MDEQTQKRLIVLAAAGISYALSHLVVNRFVNIPEQPGIKDDALEAIVKGLTTATSTILASILVRRVIANR
jgi:energy-converting hydrogenase Eha subunit B